MLKLPPEIQESFEYQEYFIEGVRRSLQATSGDFFPIIDNLKEIPCPTMLEIPREIKELSERVDNIEYPYIR